MLARARAYFDGQDVLAIDTPALSPFVNTDPALDSFRLESLTGRTLYLHTSPEFPMKRLLAAGYPDIYSIARVFRDGETGRAHLQEFTMIEWYRLGFNLDEIIRDAAGLLAVCLERPGLSESMTRIDYASALERYADIDLVTAQVEELAVKSGTDARLRAALGDDLDAWLDLILETFVIPNFDAESISVLQHFPASKAALARLCPADHRVADRFELYLGKYEIANGYVELVDPAEQRRRIEAEIETRQRQARHCGPADEHLLAALDAGLPACAGVAVGVERLQMVYDGVTDIADVVTFSGRPNDD